MNFVFCKFWSDDEKYFSTPDESLWFPMFSWLYYNIRYKFIFSAENLLPYFLPIFLKSLKGNLFHFLLAWNRMLFLLPSLGLSQSRRLWFCFFPFRFLFGLPFLGRVQLPWIKSYLERNSEIHHKLGFY